MLGLWDTEISWVPICGEGFRETHHSLQGQLQSFDGIYLPESEILLSGFPFLPPAAVYVCLCFSVCTFVCAHVCSICGVCCRDSREFRTWEAAWFRVELANRASKLFLYRA